MAKNTPTTKPPATAQAKPNYDVYVSILQAQINADIQAVKTGALDEELLRERVMTGFEPGGVSTQLALWLCALSNGLVDDLSVIVAGGAEGPTLEFIPQWDSKESVMSPVLILPVPGVVKRPAPVPHVTDQGADAQLVQASQQA